MLLNIGTAGGTASESKRAVSIPLSLFRVEMLFQIYLYIKEAALIYGTLTWLPSAFLEYRFLVCSVHRTFFLFLPALPCCPCSEQAEWKACDALSAGKIPSGPPSFLSAMNRDQKGCSLA